MTDVMIEDKHIDTVAGILAKMHALGIRMEPLTPIEGPLVTAFPFKPSMATPLNKIINKAEDLALAVAADSVDVRRIGGELIVFVPNKERKTVDFKDVLHWYITDKELDKMALPIPLGVNFTGKYAALDLAEMPHILIAGSTGSGKSVFESSIIASLCTKFTPEELELYLIDTKQLDLPLFRGTPHVKRVVHKIYEWYSTYNYINSELERRQNKLYDASARNIREYNKMDFEKLPYIVIVIDELADLIEKDKAVREEDNSELKVMKALQKLAQVARAVGIHIIACTQRTSGDIIRGAVKVNFPCRIALALPTATDSKYILDAAGAEKLLGRGDMLVQKPDSDILERFHGPFVKSDDIIQVINNTDMIRQTFKGTIQ